MTEFKIWNLFDQNCSEEKRVFSGNGISPYSALQSNAA
ncbi:hypothetical protein JCM19237_616 [Photobacterium aphoticum]|uniref:Uncharacterized protein n=1 Tax=Photobacterium aphoticum TaxID=754436 RepID=A0A090QRL5_9GAMM|nr:hypothetical protein JCM19237_616 [Photobacterium aphoticum]